MKYSELNKMSDEELVHKELQLERDLLAMGFRLKTGQLEDTSALSVVRKAIARSRTAQRERERTQGLPKDALRNRFRSTFVPATGGGEADGQAAGGFLKGIVDKIGGDD